MYSITVCGQWKILFRYVVIPHIICYLISDSPNTFSVIIRNILIVFGILLLVVFSGFSKTQALLLLLFQLDFVFAVRQPNKILQHAECKDQFNLLYF